MGDVYLARDSELDRTVAIKVLPASVAADAQRMRRFVQEAKAASSLNQQNIITIYEIGETDSTRFIVTEFVDGFTLRQHLKRARPTLAETLDIAIQTASGLAAAHEAGIVHRDVKPENIMLRNRDGFVKLLDFGLVKLTEVSSNTTDTEAPTRALVNTDAGTVMGTVAYMSPEQARAKLVDERTDIWSLGVILYEMVTGVAPFAGETSADVIAAIVKTDPAPITRLVPDAPVKLEEIISKALEKDRDERYQTIKDVLVDLRRLKKKLDFESEIERSATPDSDHRQNSTAATTLAGAGLQTASLDTARPTSSAEYLVSEIKRHKAGVILAVLAIPLLLGAAALFAWTKLANREQPAPPSVMKITKLTSGGRVNGVPIDGSTSISPDGRYVVYTLIDAGKVSIWVRQVATGSDVQIVPPQEMRNNGTTISNDGEFVYYVGMNDENPGGSLFQVPILGGPPKKILAQVRGPISFSPDGSQFAFVRLLDRGETSLMIANSDGTGERRLASRKGNDWFAFEGPAWSPDGQWVACGVGTDTGGTYTTVAGYAVADGSEKPLTAEKFRGDVRRVLWLKDGSGLVTPVVESALVTQLWFIKQPEGTINRITNDLNGYGSVSLGVSGDGKTMVTVQSNRSYQVWAAGVATAPVQPIQITHGETDGAAGLDWTADGELVYVNQTGDTNALISAKADGSESRTIFKAKESLAEPAVSPDGKTVYFSSMKDGTPHIWRINLDGSGLKQITSGDFADFAPQVSPDGKWVLFSSFRSGVQLIWKVPSDGGEAIQVTDIISGGAAFSPDGKYVAALHFTLGGTVGQIAVVPVDGSTEPPKLITPPSDINLGAGLFWSPDGRSLTLKSTQRGVGNLWRQPIDGGPPKQITNFTSDLISSFAVSRDGKRLAISRGSANLDVVLIKDFR